jgi:two-component system OmpR family sensor kinase
LERVSLGPIERFLQGRDMMPIVGDDPRHPGQRKAFSVAPVKERGQTRGYLYVILGGERHDDIAHTLRDSYIVPLSGFLLGAAVLFTLAAGLLLFYFLTRRFRTLAADMEAFKQSDFSSPVPVHEPSNAHDDELDRLTQTFSEMAARIVEQMDQLKRTDALRREMVANVSHDLRTPLASLQGYLETLSLKEEDLSTEQRRHYLAVAAKHGERLSKLVAELFELAKLDTEDAKPHCEPFSLAELVQDVTQKFRLRADEKGITLESRYTPDLPFVKADIALIERVLENLIENALRHTPSGGTIRVGLTPEANSVTVVVSDTGHGIPKQDLPHIFDRFYRVEKARGSSLSAGLGLAIAKRILELHGEAIHVRSALNKGATFLFHLPVYARPH